MIVRVLVLNATAQYVVNNIYDLSKRHSYTNEYMLAYVYNLYIKYTAKYYVHSYINDHNTCELYAHTGNSNHHH
jgi:hypothetical protein